MQNSPSVKDAQSRTFKVGLVGASESALAAFSRIFSITGYRARAYEAVAVKPSCLQPPSGVDIFVLCSGNPNALTRWLDWHKHGQLMTPLVRLAKPGAQTLSNEYLVSVPINPSKFLKTLDDYTIKELKFFPEFEIGKDDARVSSKTLAGIRLLKDSVAGKQMFEGLTQALVVDDSLPVRKQIEIEFSLTGVTADLADTAEAGISMLGHKKYDVIFLDVVMPGMDGYAACKRIRKIPEYRTTPIVLLTSRSSSFDKLKGALAGCDTYLVKPVNHNDFENVLKKHFAAQGDIKNDNE